MFPVQIIVEYINKLDKCFRILRVFFNEMNNNILYDIRNWNYETSYTHADNKLSIQRS